jgi:MoxR-like ATPase
VAVTVAYESLHALRERAKEEIGKVVVGQGDAVELLLVAAIARGHVLLEGPPGTAKTLLGRATAYVLGADFNRVQFTPDTTPTELVGENIVRAGETKFIEGTIFTNVLLADEINRTPPRTQSALLEAMAERAVTVEGRVHRLPDPFLVIATQNPYEQEGVFPLPESNLDRFLFKIYIDYCDIESEVEMLRLPHTGVTPDMLGEIQPLLGIVGLDKARLELDATVVPE